MLEYNSLINFTTSARVYRKAVLRDTDRRQSLIDNVRTHFTVEAMKREDRSSENDPKHQRWWRVEFVPGRDKIWDPVRFDRRFLPVRFFPYSLYISASLVPKAEALLAVS